jgi:putative methyltransferase (TIGR04325 family)
MKLQRLIPPIVFDRLVKNKPKPHLNDYEQFESYEQADQSCKGKGYEEGTLLRVIRRKTEIYREQLACSFPRRIGVGELQLLSVVGLLAGQEHIRVLDFGGACGAHYFLIRSVLEKQSALRLTWHVVETPGMVKAAKGLESDELRFFSSLREAVTQLESADVVFSSGAIQCVPNPYKALEEMVACKAKYIVLSSLGLTTGPSDVVVVHTSTLSMNGPGALPAEFEDATCKYPFTFPARDRINGVLHSSYKASIEVPDNSGVFPVNNQPLIGMGLIAERVSLS